MQLHLSAGPMVHTFELIPYQQLHLTYKWFIYNVTFTQTIFCLYQSHVLFCYIIYMTVPYQALFNIYLVPVTVLQSSFLIHTCA